MRTFCLAALVGAAVIATGRAQQPVQPPPVTFQSGVDIVTIDVSVFDRDRRPVRGLTAIDFTVRENGKTLPIVTFKEIALPDKTSYPADWMRTIAPDVVTNDLDAERVVVLLLDDWNTAPQDVISVQKIARGIIGELGPRDMAAVIYVFWAQFSQEFTMDRERLQFSVDRFRSSKSPIASGGANGVNMMCPHNECVTQAMRGLTEVLQQGWPGRRKTIAYVSPEGTYQVGPQNVSYGGANYGIWDSGPDLQRTFRALQEANVNVYQYDPRGLAESLGIVGGGMGMFADNSGGRGVTRTNAPEERVAEMFIENSSYYMLGFEPTGRPDTKFRPVDVDVAREDVDVRARSGYYHPAGVKEKAPKTPPTALQKAMSGALPTGTLPMTLTAAPFAVNNAPGGAVTIVGGVDRDAALPEKDVIDIEARAFDTNRVDRRSPGKATGKMQLTRRPAASGTVHYDVATRLDLPPGRYEVRLAMDSSAAKTGGSAFFHVTVPDFKKDRLSMSGIVLGRLPLAAPAGKNPLNGLIPFVPTTVRTFSVTDRVRLMVRLYQGGKEPPGPVDITTRIVDQGSRTLVNESATLMPDVLQSTSATIEHRLELPLRQLLPGEYLLTIEASAGKMQQRRDVRFRVQ